MRPQGNPRGHRRRKAMSGGRPKENRVRIVAHVDELTSQRIDYLVDKTDPKANTVGKVIDSQFGVQSTKKVAGAGRKTPRGQHGRAKQKQSRAKRANGKFSDAGGEP